MRKGERVEASANQHKTEEIAHGMTQQQPLFINPVGSEQIGAPTQVTKVACFDQNFLR